MFSSLSNGELLAEALRLAANERRATAALVRCLIEVEDRSLHLAQGYSLFVYCTDVLRLCEGAAYNRIQAARTARRFPLVLDRLADGSLTVTSIRLLGPHLTDENHARVLEAATHLKKRELEELIASLAPKPDVATVIRKLPQPSAPSLATAPAPVEASSPCEESARERPAPAPPPKPMIQVLAPERYKLQLTITKNTHDTLRQLQDLLRHTIPDGDPARIVDRGLQLLLEAVLRQKCGTTKQEREGAQVCRDSRRISAAVRRAVWKRDGGRCAFAGPHGRCTERAFLEYHHVIPYAAGGEATLDNIELRCRAHNAYEAQLFFGDWVRERDEDSFWNEFPQLRVLSCELSGDEVMPDVGTA